MDRGKSTKKRSMLEEILGHPELYVEPELLSQLDDEQKQILFIKMREEQLRRWRLRQEEIADCEKSDKKNRQVKWLTGSDGEVWVWVMGEHLNDPSIEKILEDEAIEQARLIAETEDQLRNELQNTAARDKERAVSLYECADELVQTFEEMPKKSSLINRLNDELYEDPDITHNKAVAPSKFNNSRANDIVSKTFDKNEYSKWTGNNNSMTSFPTTDPSIDDKVKNSKLEEDDEMKLIDKLKQTALTIDEITPPTKKIIAKPPPLPVKIREKPHSTVDSLTRRESEIYQSIQEARQRIAKEAEIEAETEQHNWESREKHAREEEAKYREMAHQARIKTKQYELRTSTFILPALQNKTFKSLKDAMQTFPRPPKPKSRMAIVEWFKNNEIARGGGLDPKTQLVAPWFHGIISRADAESLLKDKEEGSFLVRVSERIWGYTVSYCLGDNTIKHFLVERIPEGYQFLGTQQVVHETLYELVSYHETAPITSKGNEILKKAIGQSSTNGTNDYDELMTNTLPQILRF